MLETVMGYLVSKLDQLVHACNQPNGPGERTCYFADGLQRSFESETSPLDRYTSVPDTLTADQEEGLLAGEDDDMELEGDD